MTSVEAATDARVTFGMGCFVFEFDRAKPGRIVTVDKWREELERALLAMANVSDVDVSLEDFEGAKDASWSASSFDIQTEVQDFEPMPMGAHVTFEIVVAKRLHPELLDGETLDAERFRVFTTYGYFGPCTFVTCLDGDADGALAVRLLWRFFTRELSKHTSSIVFENLGPSPFHASCSVRLVDGDSSGWERLPRVGYDSFRFSVGSDECDGDLAEAVAVTQAQLSQELSLFYGLVRDRNYALHASYALTSKTEELVASHQRTGLRAAASRVFKSGAKARSLGLEALDLDLFVRNASRSDEDARKNVYSDSRTIGALRSHVEEMLKEIQTIRFDNAMDVVHFVEGGRSKEMEISVIAGATVLGGLAGGLVALLAR